MKCNECKTIFIQKKRNGIFFYWCLHRTDSHGTKPLNNATNKNKSQGK